MMSLAAAHIIFIPDQYNSTESYSRKKYMDGLEDTFFQDPQSIQF
jgi:hypothetical protein